MSETNHPKESTPADGSLLTDLQTIQNSKEIQVEEKLITTPEEAEDYLNFLRGLYRKSAKSAEFRGNHEKLDQEERELIELDGRELLEGIRMFIESFSGHAPKSPKERDEYKLGELEFEDMIQAFLHLYAGMATLSYRLERDNTEFQASGYQRIAALDDEERAVVATQLFNDFQIFNARRFGAEGVGMMGFTRTKNADGAYVRSGAIDLDKAKSDEEIASIASDLTYKQQRGGSQEDVALQHPAAKVSPEQAEELRHLNPHMDRNTFYKALQNSRDALNRLG